MTELAEEGCIRDAAQSKNKRGFANLTTAPYLLARKFGKVAGGSELHLRQRRGGKDMENGTQLERGG